jgi:phosphotransferase system  glucose/maltose/N-acetylglucosamine-specific IIC component
MAAWLSKKLGGWDEGQTPRLLVKATIAAIVCYFITLFVQRLLGGALSTHDTSHTPAMIKLTARSATVVGGAAVGTISFALVAGVLGIKELGPLSRLAPKNRAARSDSKYFGSTRP